MTPFSVLLKVKDHSVRERLLQLLAQIKAKAPPYERWYIQDNVRHLNYQRFDCLVTDDPRLSIDTEYAKKDKTPVLVVVKGSSIPKKNPSLALEKLEIVEYMPEDQLAESFLRYCIQSLIEKTRLMQQINYIDNRGSVSGMVDMGTFYQALNNSIFLAQKDAKPFSLMVMRINNWERIRKNWNNYPDIEFILQKIALLLTECLPRTDLITYTEDNEFLILIKKTLHLHETGGIAQQIICHMQGNGFYLGGRKVFPSLSIGLNIYSDGNKNLSQILDEVRKISEEAEDSEWRTIDCTQTDEIKLHFQLAKELPKTLEQRENEFTVLYQPQIDFKTGNIVGAEALLRWNHHSLGEIPPDKFISIYEKNNQIFLIDQWVFEKVWQQVTSWHSDGDSKGVLRFSVNLSGKQFDNNKMLNYIKDLLLTHTIPPGCIELEITEQNLIKNVVQYYECLSELRSLGARIALDDFGTGYSFLSHLRDLPADTLKIDRTFVHNLPYNNGDVAIVRAIISMGHDLGMQVVAEGIETEQQLEFLYKNNCDLGQGFFFSGAVPVEQLTRMYENVKGTVQPYSLLTASCYS